MRAAASTARGRAGHCMRRTGATALARHRLVDQQLPALDLLGTAVPILLLAVAVVVVRYGHLKLPYRDAIDPRHLS